MYEACPFAFKWGDFVKLCDSIKYVKGVGEARGLLFERLGIFTVNDLLFYLPRTVEDRSTVKKISELFDGECVCVRGFVAGGVKTYRAKGRTTVTQVSFSDGEALMRVAWFNAPYISKILSAGGELTLFGKVSWKGNFFEMINPAVEAAGKSEKTARILPIYRTTSGLGQTNIRNAISNALEKLSEQPHDILPDFVISENNFMPIGKALSCIHRPTNIEEFENARRRLAFEELFALQVGIQMLGSYRKASSAPKIDDVKAMAEFAETLPFSLTDAQKRVLNEIASDLSKATTMNRLVQGDVGSGKTAVAACAMYAVVKSGYQAIMMAPTEILAYQHFRTLSKMFLPFKYETVLLTGGMSAAEKRKALEKIKAGEASIIIGTHALISKGVEYKNPALVITDEQHRFGVRQRSALTEKGFGAHTLVMTATPIPRTLSLILYGDLDISVIDALPPGRKEIETYAANEKLRPRVFEFVRKNLDMGRQAYIICPLVEESEELSAKSAVEYAQKLKESVFSSYNIHVLHGRQKPSERREIMEAFSAGSIDILVSTTVVEVGVDVPNATIMLIENAERFGLSQLHQLRGRIGRGTLDSYCILFSEGGRIAKERIDTMCKTNNGFEISEKDLSLRGPGEFFGVRQHGLPELKIANLATDMSLLSQSGKYVHRLLENDPTLSLPQNRPLKEKIRSRFLEVSEHLILN